MGSPLFWDEVVGLHTACESDHRADRYRNPVDERNKPRTIISLHRKNRRDPLNVGSCYLLFGRFLPAEHFVEIERHRIDVPIGQPV
jgi:hypothetical protein